jgi:myo-inositol-1-phosphate synthase
MTKLVEEDVRIKPAEGKLGVLIPGLGAVASTFVGGVVASRRGLGKPVGSLTQMATIRLGKRTEERSPLIKDFVPMAGLDDLVFAAWDIHGLDAHEVARQAEVFEKPLLDELADELETLKPMDAVFEQEYVRNIKGSRVKKGKTKKDLADALIDDIEEFRKRNDLERMVMVWCASTETYLKPAPVHESLEEFERGLENNDPNIPPSMIYAYAALKCGVPFANGAPNLTIDIPAMHELAAKHRVPIAGKDFKTGQTLMKTIIAPGLKARMIGVDGWFSTNILGNVDGLVLDDPGSFKTKEESKLSVLDVILQPQMYPELYSQLDHKVRINYYPPRKDNKESWDNIDIKGWMGYPMQIKVNFLCRDSILAAPVVLDLILFMDLANRAGMYGIQEWLSFYWKSPMTAPELYPEHDLFIQLTKLKNTLRHIQGEEPITHLGLEYYK